MKKMTAREHLRQRLTDIEGGRKQQARLDAEEITRLIQAMDAALGLLMRNRVEDGIQVIINALEGESPECGEPGHVLCGECYGAKQ